MRVRLVREALGDKPSDAKDGAGTTGKVAFMATVKSVLGDEATGGVKLTDGVCHAIFRTMDRDCDGRVSVADLTAAIDDALEPDADR